MYNNGFSTIGALFKVDNIAKINIDDNNKVLDIFLDVQRVFDCVVHKLLLTNKNMQVFVV